MAIFCVVAIITGVLGVFWTPLFLLAGLLFCGYLLSRKQIQKALFFFCILLFAAFYYFLTDTLNVSGQEQTAKSATVRIIQSLQIDGDRFSAVVNLNHEKSVLHYQIKSEKEKEQLKKIRYGAIFQVSGQIEKPNVARNFNQFDYADYLKRQKIHTIFQAEKLIPVGTKQTFISSIQNFRLNLLEYIHEHFSKRTAPYVAALVTGDKSTFDQDLYAEYQKLGVVHLLAISGLHVNLFVGLCYFLLLRFGFTKETSQTLLFVILPFYALIAGFGAPVIRACGMTLFILTGVKLKRLISPICAISLVFLLSFLVNPYVVFNAGFQLSYAVSFAILLGRQLIERATSSFGKALTISIISTLASALILLFHFFEFSLIGIFLNILYVPFFSSFLVPFIFICFLFSKIPILLTPLNVLLDFFVTIMEHVTELFQIFNGTMFTAGKPTGLFTLLLVFITFLIFLCWEKRYFKSVFFFTMLFFLSAKLSTFPFSGEVSMIDIGQGDSILIQLPRNKGNYLIDTGGQIAFPKENWQKRKHSFSIGQDLLTPVLKSKGIAKLDKVFITHAHADHMGALKELASEIKIKRIYFAKNAAKKKILQEALLKLQDIPVTELEKGDRIGDKDYLFQVLSPYREVPNTNNNSLVLKVELGGLVWLFTGDAEKEIEQELLQTEDIQADILKVGHHGSKTSSTRAFIEKVNPDFALISCGVKNQFGHPNAETLVTLQKKNVQIFRTDQNGMIVYRFLKGFKTKLQ
ncbi:DNA internalization-related competence protein ComEC/Rec2 [Listeria kieliensis]